MLHGQVSVKQSIDLVDPLVESTFANTRLLESV